MKRSELRRKLQEKWIEKENEFERLKRNGSKDEIKDKENELAKLKRRVLESGALKGFFLLLKQHFQETKIDYIVSAYEADAQLRQLSREGVVDWILTEDSDLIAYGCPYIMYKIDRSGFGKFFNRDSFTKIIKKNLAFDMEDFLNVCILSGYDYKKSIRGIDLAKAVEIVKGSKQKSIEEMIRGIPKIVKNIVLPPDEIDQYIKNFKRARNTFKHQVVFKFTEKEFGHLHSLHEG